MVIGIAFMSLGYTLLYAGGSHFVQYKGLTTGGVSFLNALFNKTVQQQTTTAVQNQANTSAGANYDQGQPDLGSGTGSGQTGLSRGGR